MHDYLLRELLPLYRDLYVFGTLWSNSYASSTQISDFHQFVSRRKNYESSSIQYFRFLLSLGFSSRSSYLLQWSSRIHLEWTVLVCLHRDSFSLFVKKKKKKPICLHARLICHSLHIDTCQQKEVSTSYQILKFC